MPNSRISDLDEKTSLLSDGASQTADDAAMLLLARSKVKNETIQYKNLKTSILDHSVLITGVQSIGGAKTFEDSAVFEADVSVDGHLTVKGDIFNLKFEAGTDPSSGTLSPWSASAYNTNDEATHGGKVWKASATTRADDEPGVPSTASAGQVTVLQYNTIVNTDSIALVDANSNVVNFVEGTDWTIGGTNDATATNIATAINAHAAFTATPDGANINVTQVTAGVTGDTVITFYAVAGSLSKTDFTGGVGSAVSPWVDNTLHDVDQYLTQFDSNLHVGGESVSFTGQPKGTMIVDGKSFLKNDLKSEKDTFLVGKLSINTTDQTERVTIDGHISLSDTSALKTTTADLIWGDDTDTKIGTGAGLIINADKDLTVGRNLSVLGSTVLDSNLLVAQQLTVNQASYLQGNCEMSSDLQVDGEGNFDSSLFANDALYVSENTGLGGTLIVDGVATFKDDVVMEKKLTVKGDIFNIKFEEGTAPGGLAAWSIAAPYAQDAEIKWPDDSFAKAWKASGATLTSDEPGVASAKATTQLTIAQLNNLVSGDTIEFGGATFTAVAGTNSFATGADDSATATNLAAEINGHPDFEASSSQENVNITTVAAGDATNHAITFSLTNAGAVTGANFSGGTGSATSPWVDNTLHNVDDYKTSLDSNLIVEGDSDLKGALNVEGDSTLKQALDVAGQSTFNDVVSIKADAIVGEGVITGLSILSVGSATAEDKRVALSYDNDNNKARLNIAGDASPKGITIDDGGSVGIGTDNPDGDLQVESDSSSGTSLFINNTYDSNFNCNWRITSDSNGALDLGIQTTSFNKRLSVNNVGNIGFGTDSPEENLHIKESADENHGIILENNTGTKRLITGTKDTAANKGLEFKSSALEQLQGNNGALVAEIPEYHQVNLEGLAYTVLADPIPVESGVNGKPVYFRETAGNLDYIFWNSGTNRWERTDGGGAEFPGVGAQSTDNFSTSTELIGDWNTGATTGTSGLNLLYGENIASLLNVGDKISVMGEEITVLVLGGAHFIIVAASPSAGFSTHSIGPVFKATDTTAAIILDSGNVGIGTDAPTYNLTVAGDIMATASNVHVSNGGSQAGQSMYSPATNELGFSTSSVERIRIDDAGNVGMGTTTPAWPLDIESAGGGVQLQLARAATDGSAGSAWMGADNNGFHLGVGAYNDGGGTITSPNGLTVDTDGKVGMGTSLPYTALEVSAASNVVTGGNIPVALRISHTNQDYGNGTYDILSDIEQLQFWSPDASHDPAAPIRASVGMRMENAFGSKSSLTFGTHEHERMTIDSLGNVGIGTPAPGTLLDVAGDATVKDNLLLGTKAGLNGHFKVFQNENTPTDPSNALEILSIGHTEGLTTTTNFHITEDGKVGIGTNEPVDTLTIEQPTDANQGLRIHSPGGIDPSTLSSYDNTIAYYDDIDANTATYASYAGKSWRKNGSQDGTNTGEWAGDNNHSAPGTANWAAAQSQGVEGEPEWIDATGPQNQRATLQLQKQGGTSHLQLGQSVDLSASHLGLYGTSLSYVQSTGQDLAVMSSTVDTDLMIGAGDKKLVTFEGTTNNHQNTGQPEGNDVLFSADAQVGINVPSVGLSPVTQDKFKLHVLGDVKVQGKLFADDVFETYPVIPKVGDQHSGHTVVEPANTYSVGDKGTLIYNDNYIFICLQDSDGTDNNLVAWKRFAISQW